MTDDYEQGSMDAANTIIGFLHRKGHGGAANDVKMAWEAGTIVEPEPVVDLDPRPSNKRVEAQQQGYTGDQCSNCNSMRMQIAGHCQVCADCGTTTGCS